MKYGESAFDIIYLVFAVVTGILMGHRRETDGLRGADPGLR